VYLLPASPRLVAPALIRGRRYPAATLASVSWRRPELEICGIDPRTGRRMDEPGILGLARGSTGDAPRRVLRHGRPLISPHRNRPSPSSPEVDPSRAPRADPRDADRHLNSGDVSRQAAILDAAACEAGRRNVEWQHAMQLCARKRSRRECLTRSGDEGMYNIRSNASALPPVRAPTHRESWPYVSAGCARST